MGFFDQYKAINRAAITNAGKTGTRERLDESFANPQWKDDAIQVVKKLLEFKVEQSRDATAERLLGGLTTPLERLNAKRRQAGAHEIDARELHELVRNRSAIFKRQLPDTFKGLLRTWLRDGPAKAILVNTNTAAFLKSNDLITAAEVRTATPEAAFSRQLFANDVAAMFNALETARDRDQAAPVFPKTVCSSFVNDLAQALKDYRRVPPSLREFAEPSVRNVIRTCARASAMGGLNREKLLQPQTAIGNVNSLTNLRRRIEQKGPGHAWMAISGRRPMQTRTNWVTDGTYEASRDIGVTDADGTSLPVMISTGFGRVGDLEWIQEARSLFGPAIFEFGEHVSLADGLAAPGTRRSQQLSPDVGFKRQNFGSYASGFSELRGARGFHFAADPLDDRAQDTFDMLVMLSLNQNVPTRALRCTFVTNEGQAEVPAVQIVNATHPDLLPHPKGDGEITVAQWLTRVNNFLHYPIRISRHSREVQFLLHAGEFAIPGIAGAFWPHKYFTTRFDWCQRTNFATRTMVDETPWKCSSHCPAWVPPSRGL